MNIPYVSESAAGDARAFERRFQSLPPEAGILFVGVKPIPFVGGMDCAFEVTLGVERHIEEGTARALIHRVITEKGLTLILHIARGVRGAVLDSTAEAARPSAA